VARNVLAAGKADAIVAPSAPAALAVAVAMAALAGCAAGEAAAPPTDVRVVVEGWVTDQALRPLAGASVTPRGGAPATAGEDGRYRLLLPPDEDVLLSFQAAGHASASRVVKAGTGMHHWHNVTLPRLPSGEPRLEVDRWDGRLRCAVAAVVVEDPSSPHEHQGVRCSELAPLGVDEHTWGFAIPDGASGLVLELHWEPNTPFSMALTLKVETASGRLVGMVEGPSLLRLQVAATHLARAAADGEALHVTVLPGAGMGSHEHGAVGVFVEQPFTLFATTFHNQPADPAYSVAGR